MLHLLPIRILLFALTAAVGMIVVSALSLGWFPNNSLALQLQAAARLASPLSAGAIILTYGAWRWLPFIQSAIFPYLGGNWDGEVRFLDKNNQPDKRAVTLEAKHTLFGIRLLLDSDETTSKTLAVHAEKDPDFDRYRLYYVYLNQRKEGVEGAGTTYRGVAIVRWESGATPRLTGDYFTDTHRRGTLHLSQVAKTSWWKLWR